MTDSKDWVKRFTWMAVAALALMLAYSALFGRGSQHMAQPDSAGVSVSAIERVVR